MEIEILVSNFRYAIEQAKENGEFKKDFCFANFPRGCCGDTSFLLAQYLLKNNIKSYYAWGFFNNDEIEELQSHAWLLLDNKKTIVDITGDQFMNDELFYNYDKSIYIGEEDNFHKLFNVNEWHITENLGIDSL
ncbi:hypothetical protein HED34_03745 [Vagococcus fluvialis]|uniref:hypothetical protein n=1 Tax=Vagococcus fluvialis TaxID=2738 RepID=UPI001432B85A|nr:hypothetical protein [Vagococcus fluvialis]NKC59074.1 hypothetical protein [Vagococcus fluvialis]NKD49829.1 hypothetical protein [Vagococcus fluvialis]